MRARPGGRHLDVIANSLTAGVFATCVVGASLLVDHAAFAQRLLDYSIAIVIAWLLTLGAPTRFVSYTLETRDTFARAVWQTLIAGFGTLGLFIGVLWWSSTSDGMHPLLVRADAMMIVVPIVLSGYVGREVSNVAFGRGATSLQCLLQTAGGAVMAIVAVSKLDWPPEPALDLFLAAHYGNGTLQLLAFLVRHRLRRSDIRMGFLRESGRTNLSLGLGTLLLGNFDKLALAGRQVLATSDAAYLIADRLAGAYATFMTYYTQSRVQREIADRAWSATGALERLDAWFRHSLPAFAAFTAAGMAIIAYAGPWLRLAVAPWHAAAFVLVICATLHLKNSAGYAIRILDAIGERLRFNRIAAVLFVSALVGLAMTYHARVEAIIAAKITLHVLMLSLLRNACRHTGGST